MLKMLSTLTALVCISVYTNAETTSYPATSAEKILSLYELNELKADQKYKGKKFIISGVVGAVKKNVATGNPYVIIGTGKQHSYIGVRSSFDEVQIDELIQLEKGDSIKAVCRIEGKLALNIDAQDCTLAKPTDTNSTTKNIDEPTPSREEYAKEQRGKVTKRCQNQMSDYGEGAVKACVDLDMGALKALEIEAKAIMDRSESEFDNYNLTVKYCADQVQAKKTGWAILKACMDSELKDS